MIVTLWCYDDGHMQHVLFQRTSTWKPLEPNNCPVCFVFKIEIKWKKETLEKKSWQEKNEGKQMCYCGFS